MASTVLSRFETRLVEAWPHAAWRDAHVVLAVSGGADSVAMLRAMLAVKQQVGGRGALFVAHLNHGMRGSAADHDQTWLEQLCRRMGIELLVGRADIAALADVQGDGLEAAARSARYEFLCSVAERLGARFVATAHTADDQVETILHRIIRGTGLAGLAGMSVTRPLSPSVALVRPLIWARRSEVLGYLSEIVQDFRTDESNADPRFTRNRLRHEVLPLLRERFNSNVDDALLRLTVQAAQVQRWISAQSEQLADRSISHLSAGEVRIDCRPLADQPEFLRREVCKVAWSKAGWPLQAADFDIWQQLASFIVAGDQATPINLPGQIRAVRDAGELVLTRATRFS